MPCPSFANERCYSARRETWCPVDDDAQHSMGRLHLAMCCLDAEQPNPFCRSPLQDTAARILDIGTAGGEWVINLADW